MNNHVVSAALTAVTDCGSDLAALLDDPRFIKLKSHVESWRRSVLRRSKARIQLELTSRRSTKSDSSTTTFHMPLYEPSLVWHGDKPGALPTSVLGMELLPPLFGTPPVFLTNSLKSSHTSRSHPLVIELVDTYYTEKSDRRMLGLLLETGFQDLGQFLADPSRTALGSRFMSRASSQALCEGRIAKIFAAMLLSVAQCHLTGVAHRDIKLANFLFKTPALKESELALADFGFAVDVSPLLALAPELRCPPFSKRSRMRRQLPLDTVPLDHYKSEYTDWFGLDAAILPDPVIDALMKLVKNQSIRTTSGLADAAAHRVYGGGDCVWGSVQSTESTQSLLATGGDDEDMALQYSLTSCSCAYAPPEILAIGSRFSAATRSKLPSNAKPPKSLKEKQLRALTGERSKRPLFAADAWSLGVCLHLLLYQQMPFGTAPGSRPGATNEGPTASPKAAAPTPSTGRKSVASDMQSNMKRLSITDPSSLKIPSPPLDLPFITRPAENPDEEPHGTQSMAGSTTNDEQKTVGGDSTSDEALIEEWTAGPLNDALASFGDVSVRTAMTPEEIRYAVLRDVVQDTMRASAQRFLELSKLRDSSDILEVVRFWPSRWRRAALPHPRPTDKVFIESAEEVWRARNRARSGSRTPATPVNAPTVLSCATPIAAQRKLSGSISQSVARVGTSSARSSVSLPAPGSAAWAYKVANSGLGLLWLPKRIDWISNDDMEHHLKLQQNSPLAQAAKRAGLPERDWQLAKVSFELRSVLDNAARELAEEYEQLEAQRDAELEVPLDVNGVQILTDLIVENQTENETDSQCDEIASTESASNSMVSLRVNVPPLKIDKLMVGEVALQQPPISCTHSDAQSVPPRVATSTPLTQADIPTVSSHPQLPDPRNYPTISLLRCTCGSPNCFTRNQANNSQSQVRGGSSTPVENDHTKIEPSDGTNDVLSDTDIVIDLNDEEKRPVESNESDSTVMKKDIRRLWWTEVSESARDLTARLLTWDPAERITVFAALEHPFVRDAVQELLKELRDQ